MGTTKQKLYTAALLELGDRDVLTTENVTARRALDAVYDDVLEECLSYGSWNFAMETVKLAADTGIEPKFGYSEVFAKPTDWLRTYAMSDDEDFSVPLLQYYDDSNFWSAPVSPIYVRYVSNDTGLGLDLTRWPRMFTRYVELELALRVCSRLTQSESLRERIMRDRDKCKRAAMNKDSMDEVQPKFPPPSRWTTARGGSTSRERGSRNSLTG